MSAAAPRSSAVELCCFAALACFCGLQWVALVESPPLLGAALAAGVATATGAALIVLRASARPAALRWLAAGAVVLIAFALALVLVGLPVRLLAPGNWDELASRLGRGLEGAGSVSVPYDGTDRWTRLGIVAAVPLALTAAAVASFGPRRRRTFGRLVGLALLLVLYVVMAAWSTPETYVAQGILLLALVAGWLWAPVIDRRLLTRISAALGVAAVAAVPLVAVLDARNPLFDYRSWRLFGVSGISFGWDHSYGPLDWPQRGTLLLSVASDGAHYWKVENLDSFDGVRWTRSEEPGAELPLGGPGAGPSRAEGLSPSHPWVDRINFEVRGLRTDVVVGAGTTLAVDTRTLQGGARPAPDAVWTRGDSFERGDEYTVLAYTPDPSPEQMRAAGSSYPAEARRYTELSLPGAGEIRVPFWSRAGAPGVGERLEGTPYERVYALSRRLTAGAATPYDAAAALSAGLRGRLRYDQAVPEHDYPLVSFLFEDGRGYCQQFSGAMALMLRMRGIPARVAAGFTPGGRDPERGTFLVEDLDAHSWVEAYFPEIGWVPFDPTPSAAPAEAQLGEESVLVDERGDGPSFAGDSNAGQPQPAESVGERDQRTQSAADRAGDGSGPGFARLGGAIALVLIVLAGMLYVARVVRRRLLDPARLAAAELAELRSALRLLGWELGPQMTLLQLERRLASAFGREAWLYAVRLRERRFRDPALSPPGARERRRLRRAMLAGAGARALLALPPGGPRPLR